jgi:hypothetical protein
MTEQEYQEILEEKEAQYKTELQEKDEEIKQLKDMLNDVKDAVRFYK